MQLNSNWNVDCLLTAKVRRYDDFGFYASVAVFRISWKLFLSKSEFSWKLEKLVRKKKIKRSLIWNFLLLLRRPHLRRTPEMEMATIFHENIFLLCCTSWQKKSFLVFAKKNCKEFVSTKFWNTKLRCLKNFGTALVDHLFVELRIYVWVADVTPNKDI